MSILLTVDQQLIQQNGRREDFSISQSGEPWPKAATSVRINKMDEQTSASFPHTQARANVKLSFPQKNGIHKTIAAWFDGAIFAQYYTSVAVLLNQCGDGCNSPESILGRHWRFFTAGMLMTGL